MFRAENTVDYYDRESNALSAPITLDPAANTPPKT